MMPLNPNYRAPRTKDEYHLAGLKPQKAPHIVLVQIYFENLRFDSSISRHRRHLLPDSSVREHGRVMPILKVLDPIVENCKNIF